MIISIAHRQGGNENDSFILSDPIEGTLVMNKPLDYDHGKREYKIQIQASVSFLASARTRIEDRYHFR